MMWKTNFYSASSTIISISVGGKFITIWSEFHLLHRVLLWVTQWGHSSSQPSPSRRMRIRRMWRLVRRSVWISTSSINAAEHSKKLSLFIQHVSELTRKVHQHEIWRAATGQRLFSGAREKQPPVFHIWVVSLPYLVDWERTMDLCRRFVRNSVIFFPDYPDMYKRRLYDYREKNPSCTSIFTCSSSRMMIKGLLGLVMCG